MGCFRVFYYIMKQSCHNFPVILLDFMQSVQCRRSIAADKIFEYQLQRIGRFAHCRHDNEQRSLLAFYDTAKISHPFRRADRCAAELIYFHCFC